MSYNQRNKVYQFNKKLLLVILALLHSEWPKLCGVLAILSAVGVEIYHHCRFAERQNHLFELFLQ